MRPVAVEPQPTVVGGYHRVGGDSIADMKVVALGSSGIGPTTLDN